MNRLDEKTGNVNPAGQETKVIDQQLSPTIGVGVRIFEVGLFLSGVPLAILMLATGGMGMLTPAIVILLIGTIPGFVFIVRKAMARSYLEKIEQRIQSAASEIDANILQRVRVLENAVAIVDKAIALDKDVMLNIAKLRSGIPQANKSQASQAVDDVFVMLLENYPTLDSHGTMREAMRQNRDLLREVTAARTLYNNVIQQWNTEIFSWISTRTVAARAGFTTRIPYTASSAIKNAEAASFF